MGAKEVEDGTELQAVKSRRDIQLKENRVVLQPGGFLSTSLDGVQGLRDTAAPTSAEATGGQGPALDYPCHNQFGKDLEEYFTANYWTKVVGLINKSFLWNEDYPASVKLQWNGSGVSVECIEEVTKELEAKLNWN